MKIASLVGTVFLNGWILPISKLYYSVGKKGPENTFFYKFFFYNMFIETFYQKNKILPNQPLGQFGLVVEMSVCMFVCVSLLFF